MILVFAVGFGPMWKNQSLFIKALALTGVTLLQTLDVSNQRKLF